MDTNALAQIRELIARSNNVAIVVSANPSVDQMAGALALSLSLTSQNKKISVISPTSALVEHSSLVGIDKVKTPDESGNGDLVVSFPYREGEIDKVSYTIDGDSLNIVVKAGDKGLTFEERDVKFKRGASKPDMVISVGVATFNQLSNIFAEDILNSATVLNIDNTTSNEGYGNVVLVSGKFSSLSEQVADLLLNLNMELDIDISQNLMIGLTAATNNFQDTKTSYLAFEIASILIKRGAVRKGFSRPSPSGDQANRDQRSFQQSGQVRSGQGQRQDRPFGSREPRREERRENIREALRQRVRHQSGQPNMQSSPVRDSGVSEEPLRPASVGEQAVQAMPVQDTVIIDESQSDNQTPPPSDWLTPKVYKGSTSVS